MIGMITSPPSSDEQTESPEHVSNNSGGRNRSLLDDLCHHAGECVDFLKGCVHIRRDAQALIFIRRDDCDRPYAVFLPEMRRQFWCIETTHADKADSAGLFRIVAVQDFHSWQLPQGIGPAMAEITQALGLAFQADALAEIQSFRDRIALRRRMSADLLKFADVAAHLGRGSHHGPNR